VSFVLFFLSKQKFTNLDKEMIKAGGVAQVVECKHEDLSSVPQKKKKK
jgi:hypothetical protein